jgi:hypothetical protein
MFHSSPALGVSSSQTYQISAVFSTGDQKRPVFLQSWKYYNILATSISMRSSGRAVYLPASYALDICLMGYILYCTAEILKVGRYASTRQSRVGYAAIASVTRKAEKWEVNVYKGKWSWIVQPPLMMIFNRRFGQVRTIYQDMLSNQVVPGSKHVYFPRSMRQAMILGWEYAPWWRARYYQDVLPGCAARLHQPRVPHSQQGGMKKAW